MLLVRWKVSDSARQSTIKMTKSEPATVMVGGKEEACEKFRLAA